MGPGTHRLAAVTQLLATRPTSEEGEGNASEVVAARVWVLYELFIEVISLPTLTYFFI